MNVNISYKEIEKMIKEYYTLMIESKKNITFEKIDAINFSQDNNKKTFYLKVTADLLLNNEIKGQMVEYLSENDIKRIIKRMLYLKNTGKVLMIQQNFDTDLTASLDTSVLESVDIEYKDKKIKRKNYIKNNIK